MSTKAALTAAVNQCLEARLRFQFTGRKEAREVCDALRAAGLVYATLDDDCVWVRQRDYQRVMGAKS